MVEVSKKQIEALVEEVTRTLNVPVRSDVPGARCTTMAVGGTLHCLAEPGTPSELTSLLQLLSRHAFPWRVLGNGSNLLIPDRGISECVIRLGRGFKSCDSRGGGVFYVGGASSLMTLSRELADAGFSGIEFAGGIPASLGGAIVMNAGAHAGEMSQIVTSVDVIHADGREERLDPARLGFRYRHTTIPPGAIVVAATLRLTPADTAICRERRAHFLNERKARQPLTLPSAGSVFRNPAPDKSAGFLIESVGLKGVRSGGAEISKLHANWIVNSERKASASDVQALMARCQDEVAKRHQISLISEIVCW